MSDWQVGDLALADNGDGCGHHSGDISGDVRVGTIYRVSSLRVGPFKTCQAPYGLRLVERPDHIRGYCSCSFRKIEPPKHEACESEFVTLLTRIKRKQGADA